MSARAAERQLVQGKLRVFRGGLFSACAVALSAAAHVLGGGSSPSTLVLVVLGLFLAPVASLAAGRLRGPLAVGLTMIAVQAGLHRLFGLLGPAACVQTSSHAGHPGHSGVGVGTGVGAGLVCHGDTAMAMSSASPLMTVAHLTAAALLGLLLSRGETAVWRMLSWMLPALPGRFRTYPTSTRPRRSRPRTVPLPRAEHLVGAVWRRGPPQAIAVFA
ncbi:hypothetical protein KIH74_28990 [Kineosporia sp. J2-2]|uniref:Integral membrane protein n=1 Tax=Kineosporia corallincola TaxID=2835133 RepID=A0ABS5TPH8_9ACTN|nr:hypothetical protein [Kineosporia corallincola]MBT0773014.1 hypothetical protein [Kineosporia corallincola]